MNSRDYHADPRIGSSKLKNILRSPMHFQHSIPPTCHEALALGTAIHTAVLEPDAPIITHPGLILRSKEGKAEALSWIIDNGGEFPTEGNYSAADIRSAMTTVPGITTAEHAAIAASVAASVADHQQATDLLADTLREQSYFAGQFKARPDVHDDSILIDLKSTRDADHHAFASQAWKLKYGFSMAHYESVMLAQPEPIRVADWYWIVVAAKPDRTINGRNIHQVEVYQADADLMARSRQQFADAVGLLLECQASCEWPGPPTPDQPRMIGVPGWVDSTNED